MIISIFSESLILIFHLNLRARVTPLGFVITKQADTNLAHVLHFRRKHSVSTFFYSKR